jgi:hypothetical protein
LDRHGSGENYMMRNSHNLHSSPNISRMKKSTRIRWAGHVARRRETKIAYKILIVKPEGKRPLRRPRRKWEDNIKMDLSNISSGSVDWINLG